jgi:phage-related protein
MNLPPRIKRYRLLPLPIVQKEAKKLLTAAQLREGIKLVRMLRFYPDVPDLSFEPCGEGTELRVEGKAINPQGWLRAIFWVHDAGKSIYIVDLFWKKTNRVSVADINRANHRIRQLKALLAAGGHPWKSGK